MSWHRPGSNDRATVRSEHSVGVGVTWASMMRRAFEWLVGSVLVYLFVAACSAAGGVEGLVEVATGGLRNMMGGSFSMAGTLGTGATAQNPNGGKAETGSGANQGSGATSQGSGATQGSGASSQGSGATGQGASGGMSIIDPVPDADAAEDGTRIVNLYRTTPDGLKTPEGYWDKELQSKCSFMLAEDGEERCLPALEAWVSTVYADSNCSTDAPLALVPKGACPTYAYYQATQGTCGASAYRLTMYKIGTKATTAFSKSGDTCTDVTASLSASYDFYTVTKLAAAMFAEGTLVHE